MPRMEHAWRSAPDTHSNNGPVARFSSAGGFHGERCAAISDVRTSCLRFPEPNAHHSHRARASALIALPFTALDTYPRQPGISVEHYVFALELSDASDETRGEAIVSIRFTKDGLTSFFLDLATPANGKGMTTTGVAADSAALRYTHADNRLTITLPRPSHAGELRRFVVRYHGVPADGLRMGVKKYNARAFFS